jgi:predicted dehydrogenase
MDIVRMGIVGSGHMGRTYAHCLVDHNEGVRLVAITGGSRAPKLAKDFEVDYVPDYDALIQRDDVDAVLLATPHQVHAEQTISAAEQGKHVLVEKPMMTNVADCDAMIAACNEANVTLSVIQTLRYRGVFRRAKALIDEGLIGRVRMVHMMSLWKAREATKLWSTEPESGGMILDRGAHSFDMLRHLIGDEAVRVFGTVNSYDVESWRTMNAMVQVHFSRGASAQVWMSHEIPEPGFPDSSDMLRLWGEKGLMEADHLGKLRVTTDGEWRDIWEMPEFDFIGANFGADRLEAFHLQTQDFVDCSREGRAPAVTGEDGRAAIEMVEAANRSNLTGGSVSLPLRTARGGLQFDGATVARDKIPC